MSKASSPAVRVIAIAGGSGSGKTTFARKLVAALGPDRVAILSQDSYYHDQSARFDGDGGAVNFDHPEALDFKLLGEHLEQLRRGETAQVPIYDFPTHKRKRETQPLEARPVVLVDGTLVLTQDFLMVHFDHSVFIDVPEKVRFERRLRRDVHERGREPEGVRRQFERQVGPMHDQFVQPSSANARLIVLHGDDIDEWIRRLVISLGG
jgi:uridine kinase